MPTSSPSVVNGSEVIDDPETEDFESPTQYTVTCYGSDPDVESLVKRIGRAEIIVPDFQREYVWKIKEASRFIESLLLGLPVPGIFMAKEKNTNRMLVIDGQQRLKSLEFFYSGYFNPKSGDSKEKVFRLTDVQQAFLGRSYDTLTDSDRRQLDTAIIHATIVKQDAPAEDDTSLYHIFSRLNSGGQKLTPQEIRIAAYHGEFMKMIRSLNDQPAWRSIFGKHNIRLKDQELILRFFAFYEEGKKYASPLGEFLNRFASKHQDISVQEQAKWSSIFTKSISLIADAVGQTAFKPERAMNAAVFDSVMVGIAHRLAHGPVQNLSALKTAYNGLLQDPEYKAAITRATADETNVATRLREAIRAFNDVK